MSTPSDNRRLLVIALAVALVAAVAGGGAIWLYRQRQIEALQAKVDHALERNRELTKEVERLTDSIAALESGPPIASGPATSTTATQATTGVGGTSGAGSATAAKPVVSKEFTYLKQVLENGTKTSLVADFAQLLTGDAAAKAAAARGDESPPPNDYYIVNDNPKLRTLPVGPSATVKLTTTTEGTTVGPSGYDISLSDFVKAFAATPAIRAAPYYITITNGQVTAIAEMYVP